VATSRSKLIIGFALLIVGGIWLLNNMGAMYFDFGDFIGRAWPVAIILVGFWLLWGGKKSLVIKGDSSSKQVSQGVGDMEVTPDVIGPEGLSVGIGAGEVKLDLTKAQLQDKENLIEVKIGLGDINIVVPKDVPIRAEGRTGIGDLHFLDRSADGVGARLDVQDETYANATRKLRILTKTGLGDVHVTRA
jgi:lia operon protein LiaF